MKKTYNYSDFVMMNRMKYLLLVPIVILLAAAVYIFFIYDPNPSKDTNNGASMTLGEPKQTGSPEIGSTTATDAVEFKTAPVTLPSAKESSSDESQLEVAASDEENSGELALSDEAESAENFLSAADDDSTEETTLSAAVDDSEEASTISSAVDDSEEASTASSAVDDSIEETTLSVAVDDSEEESTISSTVDDSTEESTISSVADESMEEAITSAVAEESMEDSLTEDATAKRVTYVATDGIDSPQGVSFVGEESRETTAVQVEEEPSQSMVADDQQQLSGGYIEHKAVITSSLSQATSDAGMSANQTARIGRIFKPYLDSSRELRKGDKLTIFLDPGAAKTGNDAERIHRIEFHGARKNLVVTRKEGSLSDYEVRNVDGKMLTGEVSTTAIAVEKPRREVLVEPAPVVEKSRREVSVKPAPAVEKPRQATPVEPASASLVDNNAATGEMKRIEGVVTVTLFSAAREAGLNAGQLKKLEEILNPYINFSKEVRKGDRIVITLDGSEIYSSEFNGAVKKLTVARSDDGTYREIKPGEAESVSGESSGSHGDENSSAKKPPFWKRWFGSSSKEEGNN